MEDGDGEEDGTAHDQDVASVKVFDADEEEGSGE